MRGQWFHWTKKKRFGWSSHALTVVQILFLYHACACSEWVFPFPFLFSFSSWFISVVLERLAVVCVELYMCDIAYVSNLEELMHWVVFSQNKDKWLQIITRLPAQHKMLTFWPDNDSRCDLDPYIALKITASLWIPANSFWLIAGLLINFLDI